jgi:hypothetical protein
VHGGWSQIPAAITEDSADFAALIDRYSTEPNNRKLGGSSTSDLNQLINLLDRPSRNIWITFEEGALWWCIVKDKATANREQESREKGHFWLTCERPWSDRSLNGRSLARADLPGIVERVAGFRDTVCTPREEASILRLIRGEVNPLAAKASDIRRAYEKAISNMISELKWQDFEQLIDLVLAGHHGRVFRSSAGRNRALI